MSNLAFTAQFWDRHAQSYAKSPIKNVENYQLTLERTRSYLRPEHNVLELGAGTGSTALELAPFVAHVTATDISPAMVEIGARKALEAGISNIDFVVADAQVPNLSGPFDVVLAHNLLHLIEDLPATIQRVHTLLKPGGLFISKTFCKPQGFGPPFYYAMRATLPVMQLFGKAPYVAMMKTEELDRTISRHGFDLLEAENYPKSEIRRYIVAGKI